MKRIITLALVCVLLCAPMTASAEGVWNAFKDFAEDVGESAQAFWNSDEVQGVVQQGKDAIAGWIEGIDAFLSGEKKMPEEVADAWQTIKDAATKACTFTKEAVQAAYETVRSWAEESGLLESDVWQAILKVAGQAGADVDGEEGAN